MRGALLVAVSKRAHNFKCLVAAKPIATGGVVLELDGEVVASPTRTSIELGQGRHVEDSLGRYVNHSFSPSTFVDKSNSRLVALRNLQPGDEITFDYNANETAMSCPFVDMATSKPVAGKEPSNSQR